MFAFLQPLFLALLGIALFLYGIIHSVSGFPASVVFNEVISALPALLAVLLFSLGVLAVFVGVYLFFAGIRGVRRRLAEIRRNYGRRQPTHYDEDEDYYGDPAYR